MEETVNPARKIAGEVLVPGELQPTEQALILAALAEGESRIENPSPAIGRLAGILEQLGVRIARQRRELVVAGGGLRGFRPAGGVLALDGPGDAALLLMALLAGQDFASRVEVVAGGERCRELAALLAGMGATADQESATVFAVGGGGRLRGGAVPAVDPEPGMKLALLVAGLYADGVTSLAESAGNRSRVERLLRERQVAVERRWQEQTNHYLVSVAGGQAVRSCQVEMPADLRLAYPLMVPALAVKGSGLTVRRVALRTGQRAFLELLRQTGGQIEIRELENETADLTVRFSRLKSTRVAGQRTERLLDQVALLAVLATQTQGEEFVIRDIGSLRQGPFDYVSHLFALLRRLEARVGEFPEGLVIKGGFPLRGARIETRGDPGLVMAFAAAGSLAESETVIEGTESLAEIYPDFFDALRALQERRR
jgi:3-phosphoshikimate 1-carboxyvinyltransferase